ncbi:choline dehydrogenase-like flavoprotein [Luteibacter rhizovicinus]|uniref:Choline dehydrogenase-like flavoprotein n=1 Tax=Luteibacter rhizovicinus TaxID=242606 RepID=A0A4R3YWU3_9GAMM|nr:GMC oxidoreductase [Luteibacter rhizovicinus]TCV97627.1 choline dehydrogenase-like flavoprotein [Luteibacter rhizovicinus]
MIVDYLEEAGPTVFDVDLCVIGAGAAGIAIARSFIGSGITVCVVESGGLAGEERTQELYAGTSIGSQAFDPASSRMRVFGGSCNLWGGGCIPLGQQDMHARDWVPHSGWPLSYAELEPFYVRARDYCRIDPHEFADGSFLAPLAHQPIAFDADKLVNQVFARSPILFGNAYREELERATNITVLLHANLLELKSDEGAASINEAAIGTLDGRRGTVRARHYVLASGGIENARLLLLSDSVAKNGLGNDHDLVGRFFMDHPSGSLGTVHTDTPERLTQPYDRNLGKGPAPSFPEIGLSVQAQHTHRLLSGRVHPFAVESAVPKGLRALRELRAMLRSRKLDENAVLEARLCAAMKNGPSPGDDTVVPVDGLAKLTLRLGLGMGDIAQAFVHKLTGKPTVRSNHVELVGYFEQAPNPDSRITLGDEVDALGLRKVRIDWRLTPLDRHTYRTSATLFGDELASACGGRFELAPWLADDDAPPRVHGTAHHIGTTRMSTDPTKGVVDSNCRVHGVANLHVAGSSVFPTGGWAFPTFTIVALSLRLAEHLRELLVVV